MSTTVIEGAHVLTVDTAGTEHPGGHVVVTGDRVVAVGPGAAPEAVRRDADEVVDGSGCLLTPGLVNTHHHLYQWATRGLAVDAPLFDWLTALYPVWAHLDEDVVHDAATGALAWLARTGCTTTTDHHYVFGSGRGDLLGAGVRSAAEVGLRFHPCRGSMDLGAADGGLPPDGVVETTSDALEASAAAVERWHDPAPGSMLRVALAPCSPFSVTADLMRGAAEVARAAGVRLHTHLAETVEEEQFCRERFGRSPVEYVGDLGWLGDDVWFAHAVHLDDAAVAVLAAAGSGVAHCPSSNARLGAGTARTRALLDAGVPVGLGVDGAASNESASLVAELRGALLVARAAGGPQAMSVREAVALATRGGAAVLGRGDELGAIAPGMLADLALWRVDSLAHAGIEDPVAALVLGSAPPLARLLVGGRTVVRDDTLVTLDEATVARRAAAAQRTLLERAG